MNSGPAGSMRLNRYLALGGLGSRRGVEELIVTGQITINGEVCLDLARQVGESDVVKFGKKLVEAKEVVTIALNKPVGFVTTRDDEFGRDTVYKLLPGRLHHLRHVGRLDAESEGLLLLTNDGDLARKLTAPSAGISKEYLVTLDQPPTNEQLDTFRKGVFLPEGKAWAEEVHRVSARRVLMVLGQGLKRQIRMMATALGLRVKKLVRLRIGGLTLEMLELPQGKWIELNQPEIDALLAPPPVRKTKTPRKVRPTEPAKESKSARPARSAGTNKKRVGLGSASKPSRSGRASDHKRPTAGPKNRPPSHPRQSRNQGPGRGRSGRNK